MELVTGTPIQKNGVINHRLNCGTIFITETQTIVMKYNCLQLYEFFKQNLTNLPYYVKTESIDELSSVFKTDILSNLQNCKTGEHTFYTFENDLIKLTVMDFKQLTGDAPLDYINNVLQTNVEKYVPYNLTAGRIYSDKYNQFKLILQQDTATKQQINQMYNPKHFELFQ